MPDWRTELRDSILTEVREIAYRGRSDETSMPPCHDSEAEIRLLGHMLEGTEAEPEWFYFDQHAWLARHITTARMEGIELSERHVVELGLGQHMAEDTARGLWRQVSQQAWTMDGDGWAERVREMYRRRVLCSRLRRVVAAIETDQRGVDQALGYLRGMEL